VQTAQHLKQLQAALATTKLGPAAGDTIATAKVGERKDVKKALEVLTGSPLAPQFQPSIELAVRTWPLDCSRHVWLR
jgi:hypothetical protein